MVSSTLFGNWQTLGTESEIHGGDSAVLGYLQKSRDLCGFQIEQEIKLIHRITELLPITLTLDSVSSTGSTTTLRAWAARLSDVNSFVLKFLYASGRVGINIQIVALSNRSRAADIPNLVYVSGASNDWYYRITLCADRTFAFLSLIISAIIAVSLAIYTSGSLSGRTVRRPSLDPPNPPPLTYNQKWIETGVGGGGNSNIGPRINEETLLDCARDCDDNSSVHRLELSETPSTSDGPAAA
ncbi:uncharacterized protein BCR38DRAFT_493692 [Pseudomassariella vexata]|uniref:Uncharacterized protein n=1 Tax=Pseudomassariella vexata TaxID=1141098 RepID=A0A1Y2EKS2_9PEZI|nr:uncharacterized protein BCR38DRAFT_493692 [Pseudomassariella vexata]ORY71904.1 hypothetical protein BCR38DRAFT_493692 [Pseudomassariella vexata]